MAKVHQITPFLHVPDLREALDFFCNLLAFQRMHQESDYAYVELAGCGLRLLEEPGRKPADGGRPRVTVYVDVADIDGLYDALGASLATLPPGHVEPLANKPWHQREFQVRMPDGNWLTFGAATA